MNENLFWLAVNAYHEARSESMEGQIATCHVVLNRAEKRRLSVKNVVLQPMQFSWHNGNKFPPIKEYGAFLDAMSAAQAAIDERLEGKNLDGADHYFADYIPKPKWADKMTRVITIGKHLFFRS